MYKVARLAECPISNIIIPASILELIHTTTIIHDDILDSSKVRRGEMPIHFTYEMDTAVLLADLLLSLSLGELFKIPNENINRFLYKKIGNVCQGEIQQDLQNDLDHPLSLEECIQIAKKKTGSLFSISFTVPCILLDAPSSTQEITQEIGYFYGTIYQILDDYRDTLFDAKSSKNQRENFKHWTISSTLWNKLDRRSFLEFLDNKRPNIDDELQQEIWRRITQVIQEQVIYIREKLKFFDSRKLHLQIFDLAWNELRLLSPLPLSF